MGALRGALRRWENQRMLSSKNYWIDSKQMLHSDKDHQAPFVCGPKIRITNPRWWMAAILEKSKNRLGNGLTDRHEIWHSDAVWPVAVLEEG